MELAYQAPSRDILKAQLLSIISACGNTFNLDAYAITALDSEPCDYVAFYRLLSGQYLRLAKQDYVLRDDTSSALENYSLALMCCLKAIRCFENGYSTSNSAIKRELCCKESYNKYGYIAIMLGDMESALKFFPEDTIVGSLIRKSSAPVNKLVSELEDVRKIPINHCVSYDDEYFKQIFLAMLSGNESAFNTALAQRLCLCRAAPADYAVAVDIAAVALVKIAQEMGFSYSLDVIEIPKRLLDASVGLSHLSEALIPDLDEFAARDDLCITQLLFEAKYRGLPYIARIESVRRVKEQELFLVIFDEDKEIFRRSVLTDKPNYVHLNYMLGSLKWSKKRTITLLSKNKKESIEIDIPDLSASSR